VDEARTTGKRVRRLLFATDGSAASRAALLAVAGLAMGGETEVLVLHVTHHRRAEDGRALVTGIVEGLIALAINARPELRHAAHGHVAREIAAAAIQCGADLVVLGSRGRSDLGGLLLGSVGHEVLERVACPVLMVRAGPRPGVRPRRVLLAVAGDEDIAELVGITAAIAELEARVLVLHLLAHGDGDLQFAASAHLVDQILARLRKCGIHARGRVRAASRGAAEEIAKIALSYGADLIVMGSRRLPELTALLRGSVSHRVVNLSDRPVLVAARTPPRVSGAPGGVGSKEPAPPT
jgi:nucleotide-binding universal stress UspA family protein